MAMTNQRPATAFSATDNTPGQTAISFRLADQLHFFEYLKALLPLQTVDSGANLGGRPMAALTTRDPADPTIALLEAWSHILDILSFYSERFAIEAYLRTARARFTATSVGGGKVLLAAGIGNLGQVLNSVQVYQADVESFSPSGQSEYSVNSGGAALLASGYVLLCGGWLNGRLGTDDDPPGGKATERAQVFNPGTGIFSAVAQMNARRAGHRSVLLPNNSVLIAGGFAGINPVGLIAPELIKKLKDAEDEVTRASGDIQIRFQAAQAVLKNKGLAIKGSAATQIRFGSPEQKESLKLSETALFTPQNTTAVTPLPDLKDLLDRADALIRNPGGLSAILPQIIAAFNRFPKTVSTDVNWKKSYWQVLTQFSSAFIAKFNALGTSPALSNIQQALQELVQLVTNQSPRVTNPGLISAEVFDPQTGRFAPTTGQMVFNRYQPTATLLHDGQVLITGGRGYRLSATPDPLPFPSDHSTVLNATERYDPVTGLFTRSADMPRARVYHSATLLPNGLVLFVGGQTGAAALASGALLYDPTHDVFCPAGRLVRAGFILDRYGHEAVLLSDGKVLIAGGLVAAGALDNAGLYDPLEDSFSPVTGAMSQPRAFFSALLLPAVSSHLKLAMLRSCSPAVMLLPVPPSIPFGRPSCSTLKIKPLPIPARWFWRGGSFK